MAQHGSRVSGSSGLLGVRDAATGNKTLKFNALFHHLTLDLLRLRDLHDRIHRGAYRARPSKRAWIKKTDGRMRPLGIASLEDKVVQQAARVVLQQVYEADFLGFSYSSTTSTMRG